MLLPQLLLTSRNSCFVARFPRSSISGRVLELENQNASLKEVNSSLKDENSSLKDENSSLKDENASLCETAALVQENYDSLMDENASLTEAIQGLAETQQVPPPNPTIPSPSSDLANAKDPRARHLMIRNSWLNGVLDDTKITKEQMAEAARLEEEEANLARANRTVEELTLMPTIADLLRNYRKVRSGAPILSSEQPC